MAEKRPFLEDGSQFGVSRTSFRRMRKDEKRELMIQWFRQHFEDPAERTSYVTAEGGYLWNHGGPHDTREQLCDMFGDIVSEKLIEEVAEELEASGISDWAPTGDDYQDDDPPMRAPHSLEDFSDEASQTYGSPADRDVRKRVLTAIDELQKALENPQPIGIGHNRPPGAIENEQSNELRLATVELKLEFNKPSPSIPAVKGWGKTIWNASLASGVAIGVGVLSGIGKKVGEHLGDPVIQYAHNLYIHIFHWLQIAAQFLNSI
jgi:hypothetical protein